MTKLDRPHRVRTRCTLGAPSICFSGTPVKAPSVYCQLSVCSFPVLTLHSCIHLTNAKFRQFLAPVGSDTFFFFLMCGIWTVRTFRKPFSFSFSLLLRLCLPLNSETQTAGKTQSRKGERMPWWVCMTRTPKCVISGLSSNIQVLRETFPCSWPPQTPRGGLRWVKEAFGGKCIWLGGFP